MSRLAAPDATRERLLEQELRNLRAEIERLRVALAEARGQDPRQATGPRTGPDPNVPKPMRDSGEVVFLKHFITRPTIEVGDYTYYTDPDGPEHFERRNVLFQSSHPADRLVIGKYCSIASGVRFFMNGANHPDAGSTFPFWMFGKGWHERAEPRHRGPTVVGNDVWLGLECCVMPGVTIGDGAIVGARAVVAHDVPPFAVVAGNPARLVRRRFDEATIDRLLAIRWWDWPPERVTRNLREIVDGRWDDLT